MDRLTLTSIVDGTYLAVLPDRRFDSISVVRTRRPRSPSLLAEHGLAYHVASERGAERRQVLLDFGLTSLGCEPGVFRIDGSVASQPISGRSGTSIHATVWSNLPSAT